MYEATCVAMVPTIVCTRELKAGSIGRIRTAPSTLLSPEDPAERGGGEQMNAASDLILAFPSTTNSTDDWMVDGRCSLIRCSISPSSMRCPCSLTWVSFAA